MRNIINDRLKHCSIIRIILIVPERQDSSSLGLKEKDRRSPTLGPHWCEATKKIRVKVF